MSTKKRIFIEALPLTTAKPSGIGHMLAALVRELGDMPEVTEHYDIVLFGPRSGAERVRAWNFKNTMYRGYIWPQKLMTLLNFMHLLPPVDLWLGRGVYVFGNFVNYPVTGKSRSITYVHDMCYIHFPQYLRPKVRRVLQRNLGFWMRRTDRIVTVSYDAAKDVAQQYPALAGKTVPILHGVDTTLFYRREPSEVAAAKERYGITGDYMIFVGNIEPRKNLARLIDAAVLLPEGLRQKYGLLMVGGDGWLQENIDAATKRAQAAGLRVMRPNAYVPDEDLPALYSGAVFSVLVSEHEGFGMPLLEAMACGIPVLAADIPTLHEVAAEAGEYVSPTDVEAITQSLTKLLSDPDLRAQYVTKGLEQIKPFTWRASANGLQKIIDELS